MTEKNLNNFFQLFELELEQNEELRSYHRILNSKSLYFFRKAYVIQRLEYIINNIHDLDSKILDIGCGYGTTDLLLAYLGYNVEGTTLEFYFDKIEKRFEFWKKYLDISKLSFRYENLFKSNYNTESYDYVILQDTLHHLEPIDKALQIIHKLLKNNGQVIAVEENGNNIIQNLKLVKQRGFKKVVEIYDEKLKENYLLGNENIRSIYKWKKLFIKNRFTIPENKIQYLRLYPASYFRKYGIEKIISREQNIWRKSPILREHFFFGINFIADKS